jgi:transposase
MGNGSGVSRGDRNRNARLARLRALVPVSNAVVGIDLADAKQMVVVTDHDSQVLARRTFRCRDWAPVAGARSAGGRARDAVRVRAADADLVGAAQRGPDLRQDR